VHHSRNDLRPLSPQPGDDDQRQAALGYILDAWDEALRDGIGPNMLVNAALFAALTDLVQMYGEEPVAAMTDGLSRRIRYGEFTLNKVTQ
jgi:hypothetical protein